MALNLSTLTSPSTSDDVLSEVLTTADFLDPVPVLRNLARGSNKGGDAKQTVALNQPKALPLTANSNGVLGGYLYQPDVTGNAPAVDIPSIAANEDFVFEMEVYLVNASSFYLATGDAPASRFAIYGGSSFHYSSGSPTSVSALATGASTLTVERSGGTLTLKQDGTIKATVTGVNSLPYDLTYLSFNGQFVSSINPLNGYIKKATLSIEGTEVFNCDFTATNVRHGDTKFKCATGQTVTINQSGNDPATIIKKPVLRFDGVNSGLDGLFASSVDSGYMFAAFSVLGSGGDTYARVFTTNESGQTDVVASSWIWSLRDATSSDIGYYNDGIFINRHVDMYNDDRGDYLAEHKVISGSQKSKINNADLKTSARSSSLVLDDYHIGVSEIAGDNNAAIDLEFLALFPSSITDAQADAVRNYINNRNNVFYRWDTDGYYFFDPQSLTAGAVTSWNGRIVGSDNGDTDKNATQSTSADQPTSDGYKVTFADNTDHFDIPSTTQAGWQVVGTSLGTFAYKVDSDAVTELNLLGNLGNATYRQAGDLYGIILLPETATNRDIEAARQLLISRGAADGVTVTSLSYFWRDRRDIVEFGLVDTSNVRYLNHAWYGCSSLTSFELIDTSNAIRLNYAWRECAFSSFPLIDPSNVIDFTVAWENCTLLESFPAGMFDSWNPASITNAIFNRTWNGCTSLTPQSVENILVSIAASGKYATTSGASGGTALTDPEIDIDYDGAGLTTATSTAITTLKSRGWGIKINGSLQ